MLYLVNTDRLIRIIVFLIITFSDLSCILAQDAPKRLAFELNGGMPIPLVSIPPSFSGYLGAGVRYNVTTALSLQGSINIGSLKGLRKDAFPSFQNPDRVQNYSGFTTGFLSYMFRGQLNMERVLRLRQYNMFRKINPYMTAGIGFTRVGENGIEASRFQLPPKTYGNLNFYTMQTGLLVRYYLNPSIDLNIGCDFNYTQTYYLDGIFADQKYDHYLLNYIGINFKLGATHQKQHVEWYNLMFFERKPRKQPMDNESEPPIPIFAQEQQLDTVVLPQPSSDSSLLAKNTSKIDSATTNNGNIYQSGKDTVMAKVVEVPATQKEQAITSIQPKIEIASSKLVTAPPIATAISKDAKQKPIPSQDSVKINKPALAKYEAPKILPQVSIQRESTPKTALIAADQRSIESHHPSRSKNSISKTAKANPVVVFKADPVVPTKAKLDKNAPTLNFIENIAASTPATYTVVVGSFSMQEISYAYRYRNRLRSQGYQAALVQSERNPNMVRLMVYSTTNKDVALQQCLKARNEIESKAWIHRSVKP